LSLQPQEQIGRFGFWCGLIAAAATVAFDVAQIAQLVGMLEYPVDEVLIYATSLCIVVPFLLEMVAFHYLTDTGKQFWTHAAVVFSALYAAFVTANYVVQLATVIPANITGTASDIAILEQTPHSLFWNFDAIGYIAMGLATLIAIPAFGAGRFERLVRLAFAAHAAVTPLIAFVYFYPGFSETVLLIGLPWAITAPLFMALLAFRLRSHSVVANGDRFG
jgi:hypothetical protein